MKGLVEVVFVEFRIVEWLGLALFVGFALIVVLILLIAYRLVWFSITYKEKNYR
jgi:hypothetical protein